MLSSSLNDYVTAIQDYLTILLWFIFVYFIYCYKERGRKDGTKDISGEGSLGGYSVLYTMTYIGVTRAQKPPSN